MFLDIIGLVNGFKTANNEDETAALVAKTVENNTKAQRYVFFAFLVGLFSYFI